MFEVFSSSSSSGSGSSSSSSSLGKILNQVTLMFHASRSLSVALSGGAPKFQIQLQCPRLLGPTRLRFHTSDLRPANLAGIVPIVPLRRLRVK